MDSISLKHSFNKLNAKAKQITIYTKVLADKYIVINLH
jgi:hypothetical protein